MVVDMPGYGFAFANPHKMETWKLLFERYMQSRKSLKRVFVVIDARFAHFASYRRLATAVLTCPDVCGARQTWVQRERQGVHGPARANSHSIPGETHSAQTDLRERTDFCAYVA
eukprot:2150105-Rhodomonas_salina.2